MPRRDGLADHGTRVLWRPAGLAVLASRRVSLPGQDTAEAIAASGASIYDSPSSHPDLVYDLAVLEARLVGGLRGQQWALPIRTRAKVAKAEVCRLLGYPVPSSFAKNRPRFPAQNLDVRPNVGRVRDDEVETTEEAVGWRSICPERCCRGLCRDNGLKEVPVKNLNEVRICEGFGEPRRRERGGVLVGVKTYEARSEAKGCELGARREEQLTIAACRVEDVQGVGSRQDPHGLLGYELGEPRGRVVDPLSLLACGAASRGRRHVDGHWGHASSIGPAADVPVAGRARVVDEGAHCALRREPAGSARRSGAGHPRPAGESAGDEPPPAGTRR